MQIGPLLSRRRWRHAMVAAFRRSFSVVAASIGLAAVVSTLASAPALAQAASAATARETLSVLDEPGRVSTEEITITEGPFKRQLVFFRSNEPPGTIEIHTSERFLYLTLGNNRALRYGIGVGREGFQWSGMVKITRKTEWPDWTPPPEM